jgi:hypothetical protein
MELERWNTIHTPYMLYCRSSLVSRYALIVRLLLRIGERSVCKLESNFPCRTFIPHLCLIARGLLSFRFRNSTCFFVPAVYGRLGSVAEVLGPPNGSVMPTVSCSSDLHPPSS